MTGLELRRVRPEELDAAGEVCVAAYEQFLKTHLTRITGVASIKSSFALKQVRYETALPLHHLAL